MFEDSHNQSDCLETKPQAEMLQSKVTLLLFELVHKFPSLALAFEEANGYAMLSKVFTSSKSVVGHQLLKVSETLICLFVVFSILFHILIIRKELVFLRFIEYLLEPKHKNF